MYKPPAHAPATRHNILKPTRQALGSGMQDSSSLFFSITNSYQHMAVPVCKCPAGVAPKGRRPLLIHSAHHQRVGAHVDLLKSDPVSLTCTQDSSVMSWVVAGMCIRAAFPRYQNEDETQHP